MCELVGKMYGIVIENKYILNEAFSVLTRCVSGVPCDNNFIYAGGARDINMSDKTEKNGVVRYNNGDVWAYKVPCDKFEAYYFLNGIGRYFITFNENGVWNDYCFIPKSDMESQNIEIEELK